jgi:hypothetical protein
MNKSISTPWVVAAVVVALLVVGLVIRRATTPAATTTADPTGGVASRTLGHAGYPPPTAMPPGGR